MLKRLAFGLLELSGINRLMRHLHRGRIKILLYHNVTPGRRHFANAVSPEEFEAQLDWLKQHCNIVGIDQEGNWQGLARDRVNVLLSFDDGFVNNAEHLLPILVRRRVPAVFFLIASLLAAGARPWFVEGGKMPEGAADPYRTLDRDQARMLVEAGMTIGSHGFAHEDYRAMDDAAAIADAETARLTIEEAIGTPARLFAFPWGFHRPGQIAPLARDHARIFLTRPGFADPRMNVLPRNAVADLDHLRVVVSGTLDTVIARRNRADRTPIRSRVAP